MTRKPNFPKFMLGVLMLVLLFIGTMAITTAPRSTAMSIIPMAAPSPKPTQPPPPPPPPGVDHTFEIEGNAVDESAIGEDWNLINPDSGVSRTGPVAGSATTNATFVADIDNDTFFTGGSSKDFQDIEGNWLITTTSVPDKDEIDHAFAATYIDNSALCGSTNTCGHKILVFGGDRHATNGDANIGFWFFQGAVAVDLPNSRFTGFHQNGDLFIVSAFTQGGGTSIVDVYEWVGTPDPNNPSQTNLDRCNALNGVLDLSGDDTICKITSAGKATGIVNPFDITLDWPYTPKGGTPCTNSPDDCTATKGAFYEGGIDLTALGLGSECFASFMLETRSSQSVDAVLKDFALGQFESCSGSCNKTVDLPAVCEGTSSTFTYEVANTGGSALGQTLKDDNATPANTADDFYITGGLTAAPAAPGVCTTGASAVTINVAAGQTLRCTRTVTLSAGSHTDTLTVHTVLPFDGAVDDCIQSATVVVAARPSVAVSVLTCNPPATGFNLTATASGGTAPYTITMDGESCTGAACGGVNHDQLTIFRTVGGAYTATVTDSSGVSNCGASATRNVGYCSDGP